MKHTLRTIFELAITELARQGKLPEIESPQFKIERSRQKQHGDFACNVAMVLAKSAGVPPRRLAEEIADVVSEPGLIDRLEIAGPGFLNVFINPSAVRGVVHQILEQGERYGSVDAGGGRSITVEFVSANPTGPLHVGHGRGAAYGDALARLLRTAGYDVLSEYYVNDAGRQMDILALSVWLRYLQQCGARPCYPANAYQGDYVRLIAQQLHDLHNDSLVVDTLDLFVSEPQAGPDQYIDSLIAGAKSLLGESRFQTVFDHTLNLLVGDIRDDLEEFRVHYQNWFSEKSLMTSGAVENAIKRLRDNGYLVEKNGALWFRSTGFGDEKDRVVMRANGAYTYFASDIAYLLNKVERGFEKLVYVWGADHHGYVTRVKAAFQAMGFDPERVVIRLVQFAVLYRGGQKVQMSTRSGEFVTLRELRQEVGEDAARFFYALRKPEQHMDFDLDLAKSQSRDNPVFYIQYAHARIWNLFRQAQQEEVETNIGNADLDILESETEMNLLIALSRYPEVVESAAADYEPHQIAYYLREVATIFHGYYDQSSTRFLDLETGHREACFALCKATARVLHNGLLLLGVNAPRQM